MRINLTKKDLVNNIYMQIGLSKNVSQFLIEDILDLIIDNLISSKEVKLTGFGTFKLIYKKERLGRNPKTKEEKIISDRSVITFKPSKEFKSFINEI
tara:strand:- start:966 stop:1256 length:291 start_codon:yes stop_codon:yes gene_type:complete